MKQTVEMMWVFVVVCVNCHRPASARVPASRAAETERGRRGICPECSVRYGARPKRRAQP
jgi:hypothetical protein